MNVDIDSSISSDLLSKSIVRFRQWTKTAEPKWPLAGSEPSHIRRM